MSNPIVVGFSCLADDYLRNLPVKRAIVIVLILEVMKRRVKNFDWNKVNLEDVVGNTNYPRPSD